MVDSQSWSELHRYQSQQSGCSEASDSGYIWSEGDPLCRLPHELLRHLFSYVPPRELVSVCRLVCHAWREFFSDPSFWQLRMKQSGNYDAKLDNLPAVDWAKLCLYTVHEPNLVKSFLSDGKLSLKPWKILYEDWSHLDEKYVTKMLRLEYGSAEGSQQPAAAGASRRQYRLYGGGNGWDIEEWIKKGDPKDEEVLRENSGSTKNYVTSYEWCCRWQLVDLEKCGFTPAIMDAVRPPILTSEWFCARWDCGSIFKTTVALLDKDFKFVQEFKHSEKTAQWKGGELGWRKVKHIFQEYGKGVRYVLFLDGGKDTQYWAGHYGSKMAAANVEVKFKIN